MTETNNEDNLGAQFFGQTLLLTITERPSIDPPRNAEKCSKEENSFTEDVFFLESTLRSFILSMESRMVGERHSPKG